MAQCFNASLTKKEKPSQNSCAGVLWRHFFMGIALASVCCNSGHELARVRKWLTIGVTLTTIRLGVNDLGILFGRPVGGRRPGNFPMAKLNTIGDGASYSMPSCDMTVAATFAAVTWPRYLEKATVPGLAASRGFDRLRTARPRRSK